MLNNIKRHLKTEVSRFGFFVLINLFVLSCEQEQSARFIVEQSIEAHGGLEEWKQIKSLSLDKTTLLFLKDGTVESRTMQQQSFTLQPKLKGQIESFYGELKGLYYDGEQFTKRTNDSIYIVIDSKELQSAKNNFFAAHFVVCQPFKLLDDDTVLEYLGVEDLDGKQVNVIAVSYKYDTADSDKWIYYFDLDTHKLMANKVKHNDNVSLIKNLAFDDASGFVFNAHRKSYTLKENAKIDFLRAEYFYGNFKVEYETK